MSLPPLTPRVYVDVFSHGFRVHRFDDRVRKLCYDFCLNYVEYKFVMVGYGRSERKPDKVYAAATAMRDQYFFHIGHLKAFLAHLHNHHIERSVIVLTEVPMYEPAAVEFDWTDTERQPRPIQLLIIEFFKKLFPRIKVLTMQTGKGKGLPLHTPIKIPGGWTTMGEIKEGDIVTAKDGTPTKVTGVYPQGLKPVYRVTFADGRWVECDDTHLWKVFYVNTQPHKRWRVVDTLEVLRLISMPNPRVYIDLPDPEETPEQRLLMDPYTLGILLGDGHVGHNAALVSTEDAFIVEELRKQLPPDLTINHRSRCDYAISQGGRSKRPNIYVQQLKMLGVYGKLAHEKVIPDSYMEGSVGQRLALLQGLMDADGTVSQSGTISFCSTSKKLALQVQYLIRSLGGIAALRPRQTTYTYKGVRQVGRPAYEVDIRIKQPSRLFRLPRKLELVKDDNQYAAGLKLRVKSVVRVEDQETQCIAVDHPEKLFVVKDFIVTHNTFVTLASIHAMQARTIILLGAMYMDQWAKDAVNTLGLKKGELYIVKGSKALKDLIAMAQEDEEFQARVKLIIISQTTYRNYLSSFFANPDQDIGYRIPPWEFFPTFRAMMRVIDEVHLNFHLNWVIDCVSHVFKSVSLSATLVADDYFKNQLYATMFPPDTHAPTPEFDKYIDIYSVGYLVRDNHRLKYLNGFRQYHQATYEKSIMRHPKMWAAYIEMIVKVVQHQFIEHPDYRPGMKCAVFCGMKETVEAVVKALKAKYPDKAVRRFVDVDPDSVLLEAELIVTTLQSCGTGKDIPDLAVCVSSIALSNKQANEQLVGRLRRLKNYPDITPRFVFLYNKENPKHTQYKQARKQKLDGKIRNFNELTSDLVV